MRMDATQEGVVFTAELREDLRRRDFTINAMAYSHETGIVDIFGGAEDLQRAGSAASGMRENDLRKMRSGSCVPSAFRPSWDFDREKDLAGAL